VRSFKPFALKFVFSQQFLFHNWCILFENKKTCGLSRTGPYKLKLFSFEIAKRREKKEHIAKMKTRSKNFTPNRRC